MNRIIQMAFRVAMVLTVKSTMVMGMEDTGERQDDPRRLRQQSGREETERRNDLKGLEKVEGALPMLSLTKLFLPKEASAYEAIYQRFLNGVLVYRPNEGNDDGKVELPIASLENPFDSSFDLSRCGDAGRYLSISTGYRKAYNPENKDKLEMWLAPRFLIEKNLVGPAGHYEPIMLDWDEQKQPMGLFFNLGGWKELQLTDNIHDELVEAETARYAGHLYPRVLAPKRYDFSAYRFDILILRHHMAQARGFTFRI